MQCASPPGMQQDLDSTHRLNRIILTTRSAPLMSSFFRLEAGQTASFKPLYGYSLLPGAAPDAQPLSSSRIHVETAAIAYRTYNGHPLCQVQQSMECKGLAVLMSVVVMVCIGTGCVSHCSCGPFLCG